MTAYETATTDQGAAAADVGTIREQLGLSYELLERGLAIAENQHRRGQTIEALQTYSLLVIIEPEDVTFQAHLALYALKIHEYHLAGLTASAIVSLDPESPLGYYLSGHAAVGLENYAGAREDFAQALRLAHATNDDALVQEVETTLRRIEIVEEVKHPEQQPEQG